MSRLFDTASNPAHAAAPERWPHSSALSPTTWLETTIAKECACPGKVLSEPGAKQILDSEPISWIADNQRKEITAISNSVNFHAGPKFSLEHWDKSAEEVALKMLNGQLAKAWKLHRWKYSKSTVLHVVNGASLLVLAGVAFGEARVEGAALSGLSAAERLLELL